jgi:hypothetical protein
MRPNQPLFLWSAIAAVIVFGASLFFISNEAPNEPPQTTPSLAVPAPPPNQ